MHIQNFEVLFNTLNENYTVRIVKGWQNKKTEVKVQVGDVSGTNLVEIEFW